MFRWFKRSKAAQADDLSLSEITPSETTADQFCEQLQALAPSVEQLMAEELTADEAEQMRRMWVCRRVSRSDESDPLMDLCRNFDLKSTEIGYVTLGRPRSFDQSPYEGDPGYWVIGYLESDPIVYPKSGGTVSVRNHERPQKTIYRCARTPQGFLSALLVAAEFDKDEDAKRQALERCIALAGRECEPFYRDLMNVGR